VVEVDILEDVVEWVVMEVSVVTEVSGVDMVEDSEVDMVEDSEVDMVEVMAADTLEDTDKQIYFISPFDDLYYFK
jgi:hypothetical protein